MPNITRGERMSGLLVYLAGPGKANEHTEPHLVAGDAAILAWHDDTELSRADALRIARELDHPRRAFGVDVPGGSVWHCSLSLRADEGQLTDDQWTAIATDFVDGMGFTEAGGSGGAKAPCRWVAVRHGRSTAGNDHIHLAVSLVREDGTKANIWNDRPRVQTLAGELERRHGLAVLESRGIGMGTRGIKPAEQAAQRKTGALEPVRARLERTVRAVAATSGTEAEFVRGARGAGLLIRPRFASGRDDVVVGFSVAARPPAGERPVWFGGGRLARDLTLPRLRESWPDSPQHASEAVAEWQAAWRGKRTAVRGPGQQQGPEVDPALWTRYAAEVAGLREQLRAVPAGEVGIWSQVAGQLSGAFAAWSLAAEGDRPGPLAATAATLARSAQVRRGQEGPGAGEWGPSIRGASLLLASAARGGRGPVGAAVLLRQLTNTARAVHDAHAAAGRAGEAQRIATAVLTDLEQVRSALPSARLQRAAELRAGEAGQTVGGGRQAAPGSPVPAHLQPHRRPTLDQGRGVER